MTKPAAMPPKLVNSIDDRSPLGTSIPAWQYKMTLRLHALVKIVFIAGPGLVIECTNLQRSMVCRKLSDSEPALLEKGASKDRTPVAMIMPLGLEGP
jgi:hypothetical protein